MLNNEKIYVAGHTGLVGSSIMRALRANGFDNLLFRDLTELDLCNPVATASFFETEKPDYVFLAAAKVGGIRANDSFPADFIRINLEIQNNVIHSAYRFGVKKLLFLGSSCIYPQLAPQPLKEEYLLSGFLEPTNDAYAIAKIAGLMMCQAYNRQHGTNFIGAMPTNLFGINDNFDLTSSHVLPALIRKFHEAKLAGSPSVEVWGSGTPKREFLFVDDLADALLFLMQNFNAQGRDNFVNVGIGEDVTIRELAELVSGVVGYQGQIHWNKDMPDGTPRKLLDVSRLHALGWKHKTSLSEGLTKTYGWYVANR